MILDTFSAMASRSTWSGFYHVEPSRFSVPVLRVLGAQPHHPAAVRCDTSRRDITREYDSHSACQARSASVSSYRLRFHPHRSEKALAARRFSMKVSSSRSSAAASLAADCQTVMTSASPAIPQVALLPTPIFQTDEEGSIATGRNGTRTQSPSWRTASHPRSGPRCRLRRAESGCAGPV
jgi:hypothetical protein